MTKALKSLSLACATMISVFSTPAARADIISFTPNLTTNTADIEGSVPFPKLGKITLPKGSVELEDGILSVNIIPEWNFDPVPVLRGPIIRTEVATTGREAVITGVALFQSGYWFDRFAPTKTSENVVSVAENITGLITGLSTDSLTITDAAGVAHIIPLANVREIHSPRAFAFALPALAPSQITPDQAWKADARAITLEPTTAGAVPSALAMRHEALLQSDGDYTDKHLWMLGTALSLGQLAQFAPEIVLPCISHGIYKHVMRKEWLNITQSGSIQGPQSVAPLRNFGNTYSLPVPFNSNH